MPLCEAATWAPLLVEGLKAFRVDNPLRMAAFLAQVAVESSEMRVLEENLNYSVVGLMKTWPSRFPNLSVANPYAHLPRKIAAKAYGGRMGNGDEESGDGWRYRGRGLLQVTGRDNYRRVGEALGLSLLAEPGLLLEPLNAVRSAGFFWATNGLNEFADRQMFEVITRRINGGTHGMPARLRYYETAKAVLGAAGGQ